MLAAIALAFGLSTTFILSAAGRNRRAQRANALTVELVGRGLMGASFATAGMLIVQAARLAAGA